MKSQVWSQGKGIRNQSRSWLNEFLGIFLSITLFSVFAGSLAFGQADQGAVTGVITDPSGAVIPNAHVTLTNLDTGLVLKGTTDASGVYTFSPVKIGQYSVSATAPGFSVVTQTGLQLNVQQRLAVNLKLAVGGANQSVEVTTEGPLLQTEDASVGQTISTQAINDTPLNGRNWMFIAQLTAGTNGVSGTGSKQQENGAFSANGQRIDMDNFVLDGVDNNNNVVDFLNGATYVVRPPPDALQEFQVQTSNYSAEFGHAAGGVVNASIKSGTNQLHGSAWEYVRNTDITAKDWEANTIQPYHENQFGATLGGPILKDRLFLFGDTENNRIALAEVSNLVVPTPRMRVGDFGELDTNGVNLFNGAAGVQLYNTNAAGAPAIPNNDLRTLGTASGSPGQLDPTALNILSLYPCPNATTHLVNNSNCQVARPALDNTFQFDLRMDYIIRTDDQAFMRYSQSNEKAFHTPPLGSILDGGAFGDTGNNDNLSQGFVFSETHVFAPTLTNEFRVGYTYGHYSQVQVNAQNPNIASSLGLGGIPNNVAAYPGGLPALITGGQNTSSVLSLYSGFYIQAWGTPSYMGTTEHLNNVQILDNVTKILGNHSLKFGVNAERIRFATYQPSYPHGYYNWNGQFTSAAGAESSSSGSGAADFLLDEADTSSITADTASDQLRWDTALFAEDDWKATKRLTLNLGVRWEDPTAYRDIFGRQANFVPTGPLGVGTGTAEYLIPNSPNGQTINLGSTFPTLAAANNVSIVYTPNQYLVNNAWNNFGPRLGFAYTLSNRATIRGGWGFIAAGLENIGYGPNIGQDFPFLPTSSFPAPSCSAGNCTPSSFGGQSITLEAGFTGPLNATGGIVGSVTSPTINAANPNTQVPYAEDYNLTAEYAINNNSTMSVAYVGSQAHKLTLSYNVNNAYGLSPAGSNINPTRAFPGFGTIATQEYWGQSSYNSLQVTGTHRYSNGLYFSANYTWSHSIGVGSGLVGGGGSPIINSPLVPVRSEASNTSFDSRNRFTFNGNYELPFGVGRRFANTSKPLDYVIGGWALSATLTAQSGVPITIGNANGGGWSAAAGASGYATLVGNAFQGGGTPPTGTGLTACPAAVHTRTNWFNPCAFRNPTASGTKCSATITTNCIAAGTVITGAAALPYLGSVRGDQIDGPGFSRLNASMFKTFKITEKVNLQFRADAFNVDNHPTWANPGNLSLVNNAGVITGPLTLQVNAPDARFFQLSLRAFF